MVLLDLFNAKRLILEFFSHTYFLRLLKNCKNNVLDYEIFDIPPIFNGSRMLSAVSDTPWKFFS